MLSPSYSLKVGSTTYEPGGDDDLITLRVSMDMGGRAGCSDSSVTIGDGGFSINKDDSLTVSLGYRDDLTEVFKGAVDLVDVGIYSAKILGLNSIAKLLRLRVNKSYENQSCGAIVSDLAQTTSSPTGEIEDGLQLPYYTVGSNKNAYGHILELADRCGFDVYATSDDQLTFKKYEKSSSRTLEYGKDIIHASRLDQENVYTSIKVFGESPSSSQGDETVHWLTKSPVQGESGSGTELIVQDPLVRNTDAATSVAKAIEEKLSKNIIFVVDIVGDPVVKLNDTVRIQKVPESTLNGEYQVRGIEHYLSKSKGFTTSLRLSGKSEG